MCVCVRERETIKSTRLVHHRDDLPMGGAFLTPFMSCFPQRHRALRSDATFRHFGHANPDSGL